MPAGPARKARRAAPRVEGPPIEIPEDHLSIFRCVASKYSRRLKGRRKMDGADLYQEVCLAYVQSVRSSDGGEMPLSHVERLATFAVRDAMRRCYRSEAQDAAAWIRARGRKSRAILDQSEILDIKIAVESLDGITAEVVHRHYMAGETDSEQAGRLGVSRSAVTQRDRKGREKIKAILGGEWAELWGHAIPMRRPEAWKNHRKKHRPDRSNEKRNPSNYVSNPAKAASKNRCLVIDAAKVVRDSLFQ